MTEAFILILSILLATGKPQELAPPRSFSTFQACDAALQQAKHRSNHLGATCVRRDIYCKLRDCTHMDEQAT